MSLLLLRCVLVYVGGSKASSVELEVFRPPVLKASSTLDFLALQAADRLMDDLEAHIKKRDYMQRKVRMFLFLTVHAPCGICLGPCLVFVLD